MVPCSNTYAEGVAGPYRLSVDSVEIHLRGVWNSFLDASDWWLDVEYDKRYLRRRRCVNQSRNGWGGSMPRALHGYIPKQDVEWCRFPAVTRVRLEQAHALIVSRAPIDTITTIGYSGGGNHLSRGVFFEPSSSDKGPCIKSAPHAARHDFPLPESPWPSYGGTATVCDAESILNLTSSEEFRGRW